MYVNKSQLVFPLLLGVYCFIPGILYFIAGASVKNSVNFTLYTFIYHGLNGLLFLSLFKQDFPDSIKIPATLISGICFNILTFFLLSFFHLQEYSFLNIFLLLIITMFSKTTLIKFSYHSRKSIVNDIWVFFFILFIFAFYPNSIFPLSKFINDHTMLQAAIANQLMYLPYPCKSTVFPEIPLYYNIGYHLEMAFCALRTSIPVEVLTSNLLRIYSIYLFLLLIYSFCKEYLQGKRFVGALTILCVVLYTPIGSTVFLNYLLHAASFLASVVCGILVFFILICKINTLLEKNKFNLFDYSFIFLLSFVGAIIRAPCSVVLIGGMSLFYCYRVF